MIRRIAPALALYFLAPLVSEFLLGDFPVTKLGIILILAPMYGGGALLIREIARRTGGGWPMMITLALAYGIFEEAFTTQTLFNPNYLGLNLHLLDSAFIPALGIGAWWTVFVLTLHTVWSVSVSIGLTEALVPERAAEPWLRKLGLAIVSILFVAVAIMMTKFSIKSDHNHFIATKEQFVWSAVLVAVVGAAAFFVPRSGRKDSVPAPNPWVAGFAALLLSSLFEVTPPGWGWGAVACYLALDTVAIVTFSIWSRRSGWNSLHRLALAGGAALTYAWHAFFQAPVTGGTAMLNLVSHLIFGGGLLVLLWFAGRRTARFVAV
ncbi:MAG TPA: hypothetical protein VGG04_03940 [Candidatus Sulfotelmatobacter sp.]|jgi:hypothetical protein